MRILVVSLVFAFLMGNINARPSQVENKNSELNGGEYDDESAAAADESSLDEEMHLKDQDQAGQEEEVARNQQTFNGNTYQEVNADNERSVQPNADFPDYEPNKNSDDKIYDDSVNANNDFRERSVPKRRQSNRYIENNDANEQQETAQHLTNRDVKNYKSNPIQNNRDNQVNKRTAAELDTLSNEEGELLFSNNEEHMSKRANSKYNKNDVLGSNTHTHYDKQYHNTMPTENKRTIDDKRYEYTDLNLERDRRDISGPNLANSVDLTSTVNTKAENGKSDNEDEEAAIKRHVKKLSGQELEELLNTLTEEKRALLKKIIEENNIDDSGGDGINKREITKKAGAVEENNYIESGQPDISKIQGSRLVDTNTESSISLNNETTEINKHTAGSEISDMPTSKSADTNTGSESRAGLTGHTEDTDSGKSDIMISCSGANAKNQAEINSIVKAATKNENKREIHADDFDDMAFDENKRTNNEFNINDSSSDQAYCSQDEDLSRLMEDEAQLHDNSQGYKLTQHELAESVKSLGDSFPNANAYHDSISYSGNLVRVKRKDSDQIVKKRAAGILPDAKVGYFPYKSENDDEDSDEGNEFDDDGFYDRTSNFAKSNPADDSANHLDSSHQQRNYKSNFIDKSRNGNIARDSSLGSDTDSVISGVEGVDDNLMYNSGSRGRRNVDMSKDSVDIDLKSPIPPVLMSEEEIKTPEEHEINLPNYQENDAFGSLPRSYDGDSGRYKRIRRLKQSHNSEEIPHSNDT